MAHVVAQPALFLILAASAGAQVTKLSAPLPIPTGAIGGPVLEAAFTADGTRVVYRAPQDEAATPELYSAPADGSQPAVKLSGFLAAGVDHEVLGFELDPTGTWVAFHVGSPSAGSFAVHAARVDGSGEPVSLGTTSLYAFTPDGERLVMKGIGLQSRAVDGSDSPLVLDPDGGDAKTLAFTPDGTRLLYTREVFNQTRWLYSVPTDASAPPVQLSTPSVVGSRVEDDLRVTPDGQNVVYRYDPDVLGQKELFIVPVTGGTPLKLSPSTNAGVRRFDLSATTGRVVYVARIDRPRDDLYSVPLDGGPSKRLSPPLGTTGDVIGFPDPFLIAPDGTRVLFSARSAPGVKPYLYVADLDGNPRTRRVARLVRATGDLSIATFAWSTDSRRAVYTSTGADPAVVELYGELLIGRNLVRVGGAPRREKLSGPLVAGGNVLDFRVSPDGARVLYLADQEIDGVAELHAAPLAGPGGPQRISAPLVAGGTVHDIVALDASGARALYHADGEQDEWVELFSAPTAGGTAVKLNGPLDPGTPVVEVDEVHVAPGGGHALYQEISRFTSSDAVHALRCVDLTTGSVADLSPGVTGEVLDSSARFSPDGSRVVFATAPSAVLSPDRLYSAPVDGSLPAVLLTDPPGTGDRIDQRAFAPGGATLAYRVFSFDGTFLGSTLHAVPTDGSAPALLLHTDVHALLLLHPDGQQVAYHAGTERDLYLGPLDGSVPPVRLVDATLPRAPTAVPFQSFAAAFTPDGSRIVFCDELDVNGEFELYSVSTTNGLPPIELSGTLVAGGDVGGFEITADGTRVVYLADANVDGRTELFSVPVDGGSAPVVLSRPVTTSVARFVLSPDGTRVAFEQGGLCLAPTDGSVAPVLPPVAFGSNGTVGFSPDGTLVVVAQGDSLQSLSSDGTGPVVTLNAALADLVSGSPPFVVSADSRLVVYRSAPMSGALGTHLYASPLDGLTPPVRLDVTVPDRGSCTGPSTDVFALTPDGTRALFLSDHEVGTISELYEDPLP